MFSYAPLHLSCFYSALVSTPLLPLHWFKNNVFKKQRGFQTLNGSIYILYGFLCQTAFWMISVDVTVVVKHVVQEVLWGSWLCVVTVMGCKHFSQAS